MSNVGLLLGSVSFRSFEVPATINVGGTQQLAVHRLLGGIRVIDALGRDDSDISFDGIFSGPEATLRAQLIDEMRVSGLPVPLTWDVFFYSVIVKRFEAQYRSGWWIPYRITCAVVQDAASNTPTSAVSSADSAVSDVTTALGFAAAAGIDLSETLDAVSAPGASVRGTAPYSLALGTLASANANIGTCIGEAEPILGAGIWPGTGSAPDAARSFSNIVSAAQQISVLATAQAYIERASTSLINAST